MYPFSKSISNLRSSEIRDLLKLATRPDIISFAGGMPNNNIFPVDDVNEIYNNLNPELKKIAFQYGPTAGFPKLLDNLKNFLREKGLPVDKNKLMITTGSTQAINVLTKEFVDPGDYIITEKPCFIGALSSFRSYEAKIESIPVLNDGINLELLEKKLDSLPVTPKLIYLTPNFHNPAGITYSKQKRKDLLKLLGGRGIIMIEDDAYANLYFDEEMREMSRPMKCEEPDNVTICYTGSFSKILGPGLRLGWLLVSNKIFEKSELIKQAMDACSPNFTQIIASEFLEKGKLEPYLEFLRKDYFERKELTQKALEKYMPDYVKWNEPRGGFYYWCEMPVGYDATDVMSISIQKGAVFVSGKTFDPAGVKNNNFRLSYSNMSKEQIDEGIKIIAEAIKEYTRKKR